MSGSIGSSTFLIARASTPIPSAVVPPSPVSGDTRQPSVPNTGTSGAGSANFESTTGQASGTSFKNPKLTPELQQKNLEIAREIAASPEKAREIFNRNLSYFNESAKEVRADFNAVLKEEVAKAAETNKSFMQEWGKKILFVAEVIAANPSKYNAALWAKGAEVFNDVFAGSKVSAVPDFAGSLGLS